jgi:hypothetical protein
MTDSHHPSYLLKLSTGFMPSRIFLTALELEVLGKLGYQQLTARQTARELQTDERSTEILLNALTAIDIPEKNDDLCSSTSEIKDMLPSCNWHERSRIFGDAPAIITGEMHHRR